MDKRLKRFYFKHNDQVQYFEKYGVKLKIYPSVFHPKFFFSTQFLAVFLAKQNLKGKRFLELGAGSAYLSFLACEQGAEVTSSDVNRTALKGMEENARKNNLPIRAIYSDLFEAISPNDFDWIVINPPYYPQRVTNDREAAFYCGEDFDYFKRLFGQIKQAGIGLDQQFVLILSEDCAIERIKGIAAENGLKLELVERCSNWFEVNYIFKIR